MCLLSFAANMHLHEHVNNVPSAAQLLRTPGSVSYCISLWPCCSKNRRGGSDALAKEKFGKTGCLKPGSLSLQEQFRQIRMQKAHGVV